MSIPRSPLALSVRAGTLALGVALLATPFGPSADAAITRPFVAKWSFNVSPGIHFAKGTLRTTGWRLQSVRVATIETTHPSVHLKSVLSNEKVVRRERVTRMGRRRSHPGMMAMVATNGDRFRTGAFGAHAAPSSMHVSNGELMVAQVCTRPTLGIDGSGRARIDDVRARLAVYIPGFDFPRIIHRVNTHRDDSKVVLFTNRFGPSTQTSGGLEVVISLPTRLRPSGSQDIRVLRIRNAGDTQLRAGEAVVSIGGSAGKWVRQLKVGQRMRLETTIVRGVSSSCDATTTVVPGWNDIREAIGGNYRSVGNGQVNVPSATVYPAGAKRHPLTNVGITGDGRVLMVTVDGRQPGYSVGMTLAEMGQLMVSLGARQAFNLDGGGETVMAKRNKKTGDFVLANKPSDGKERAATQALVAFEYSKAP